MVQARHRKPRKNEAEDEPVRKSPEEKPKDPYDIDKLAYALFIIVPFTITSLIAYFYYQEMMSNLVSKPSSAPPIITKERAENMDRFWGTYRPGVYFGTKTRSANSPVTGLMWFQQNLPNQPLIRHWCEQNDKLTKYGWLKHNGNDFGVQEIQDHGYTLTTEYVKRQGGENGGDWSARITATDQGTTPSDENRKVSLFYYFVSDGQTDIQPIMDGHKHMTGIEGHDSELGEFKLNFRAVSAKGRDDAVYDHMITYTPEYRYIEHVMKFGLEVRTVHGGQQHLGLKGRLVPRDTPGPNMYVYQVTGHLPLTLEVSYESASNDNRPNHLTGSILDEEIKKRTVEFDEKFESKFELATKGLDQTMIKFAQAAMSNMLGGIGFFFGASKVQSEYNPEPIDYWEASLFTAVPSRSFFPRGFLWDEGFHNLLISQWDQEISMDIIGHWLDLMNTEGWIPREQILGSEARAKVPDEFVVQRNVNANPPTFFLPLERIIQNLIAVNDTSSREYLANLYPRLKTWYKWFNTTQSGEISGSYRWRGRDPNAVREINPKTLTSGLDDYPRASHPTDEERHLDLRCWMALASKVMANIGRSLNDTWKPYQQTYETLSDNQLLNELHWSSDKKRYGDYGLHTDGTKLKRPPRLPDQDPNKQRDMERVVTKEPTKRLVTSYFGYVSLFPLLTQILDAKGEQLGHLLTDLRDEKLLWTNYGLRSLAKTSPLYQKHNTEHDPPYWRGAIWINMNYLAIRSLHHYSQVTGPHQSTAAKLYTELRQNVMYNLLSEYKRTGYIWEQYDDQSGMGKGCHPFTGWSSLVTLIMAEKY